MTDLNIFEAAGETELKILEAAQKIFSQKGFDGARMREIAGEAKINKAALHYYFRSKEKLFEIIFRFCLGKVYENLGKIIEKNMPLKDKIKYIVENYIDFISKNQYLIPFIMTEVVKNPDRFVNPIKKKIKLKLQNFINQIKKEIESGNIREIDPFQLIINIVSMCIFPFPAKPMLCAVFEISEPKYKKLMEDRKELIVDFVMASLEPKK